jgi:hypothetical protein
VTVQNMNRMQKALASEFMALTISGTYSVEGASIVARRAIIMNSGAPGGCPTSSL